MSETTSIELLTDGRLANLEDWNQVVAQDLASADGITLHEDHWLVINTMREYYDNFKISPVKKLLLRELRKKSNSDKFSDEYLQQLFPQGVQIQGSKIAGVPLPYLDVELESSYAHYSAKSPPSTKPNSLEFNGEKYPVTQSGNLVELHRWNEPLAQFLAEKEGIKLSADHWDIVNFLREFYFKYGISPMVKILMRHLAEERGPDMATRDYLYSLFPKGPSRQGSRIAGLPEPQGCIDADI
jgi:tRNA 2-thiouridine synthesizing protein E